MINDPRKHGHVLTFSQGQGDVCVLAGAIESVSKQSMAVLKIEVRGHMTFYVDNTEGLFAELLRSMAACAEYSDAQAELAAEAIK